MDSVQGKGLADYDLWPTVQLGQRQTCLHVAYTIVIPAQGSSECLCQAVYSLAVKGKVTYQGNVRMIRNALFECFLKKVLGLPGFDFPPLVILLCWQTEPVSWKIELWKLSNLTRRLYWRTEASVHARHALDRLYKYRRTRKLCVWMGFRNPWHCLKWYISCFWTRAFDDHFVLKEISLGLERILNIHLLLLQRTKVGLWAPTW